MAHRYVKVPVICGCLSPRRYRLNWILSSRDIKPGRYVPMLHQRPPEQEPRERPPCSVRNNRVSSSCPEFHGNDLFRHTYIYTRIHGVPGRVWFTYFGLEKYFRLHNVTHGNGRREAALRVVCNSGRAKRRLSLLLTSIYILLSRSISIFQLLILLKCF